MHTADIVALLPKDLDRLKIIERYKSGHVTQVEAAHLLAIRERQIRQILRHIDAL